MKNVNEFNKQNFNVERIRNKNKKILENIIKRYNNVEKEYIEEKRRTVIEIENNDELDEKEKNITVENEFRRINNAIEIDKLAIKNELKDTINKQVKYLLILKDSSKIYEYYKLMTSNPLEGKYAELESNLYREFLMRNPSIENIIIYYSELENFKNENNIEETVKDKEENLDTTSYDIIEDEKQDINNLNKFNEIEKSISELEKSLTRANLEKAKNALSKLESSNEKNEYAQKITNFEQKIEANELKEKENEVYSKLERELKDAVNERNFEKLSSVQSIFDMQNPSQRKEEFLRKLKLADLDMLVSEAEYIINNDEKLSDEIIEKIVSVYKIIDEKDRAIYKDRINNIINLYNIDEQRFYQEQNLGNLNTKKYGFMTRLIEFFPGTIINSITESKLYKKYLDKKYKKAKDNQKQKKIDKYKSKINDLGIVNGVRLFINRNKIASLSPKLYNTEYDSLSKSKRALYDFRANKMEKAEDYVTHKFVKKLDKYKKDNYMMSNKNIVKNMIMQYIDALSLTNDLDIVYDDAKDFIESAYEEGNIETYEYYAYIQEINNIRNFRESENMNYDASEQELNDMINYYDSEPISNEISYVKRK